jgi:hypothetical protein
MHSSGKSCNLSAQIVLAYRFVNQSDNRRSLAAPAKNWFARGLNFIKTRNTRGVRRSLHQFRVVFHFLRD